MMKSDVICECQSVPSVQWRLVFTIIGFLITTRSRTKVPIRTFAALFEITLVKWMKVHIYSLLSRQENSTVNVPKHLSNILNFDVDVHAWT